MTTADRAVLDYLRQAPDAPPVRIEVFPERKRAWQDLVARWKTPRDRPLVGSFVAGPCCAQCRFRF